MDFPALALLRKPADVTTQALSSLASIAASVTASFTASYQQIRDCWIWDELDKRLRRN
jgi:hypothetical protein